MPTKTPTIRKGKIDPVKAYQMRVNQRMTYQQIADQFDVSKSSVIERLQHFSQVVHNDEQREAFENIRVNAMTTIEEALMASLTDPSKIAKASLNNVAYAFQQIHTARRLEEDKSTANTQGLLHVLVEQAHAQLFKSKPNKIVSTPNHTPISQETETPETDDTADTTSSTA